MVKELYFEEDEYSETSEIYDKPQILKNYGKDSGGRQLGKRIKHLEDQIHLESAFSELQKDNSLPRQEEKKFDEIDEIMKDPGKLTPDMLKSYRDVEKNYFVKYEASLIKMKDRLSFQLKLKDFRLQLDSITLKPIYKRKMIQRLIKKKIQDQRKIFEKKKKSISRGQPRYRKQAHRIYWTQLRRYLKQLVNFDGTSAERTVFGKFLQQGQPNLVFFLKLHAFVHNNSSSNFNQLTLRDLLDSVQLNSEIQKQLKKKYTGKSPQKQRKLQEVTDLRNKINQVFKEKTIQRCHWILFDKLISKGKLEQYNKFVESLENGSFNENP